MQHGIEARRPAFFRLAGLPEEPTGPAYANTSFQHPDHDTERWPPGP
jgi:hypothetical protein